jgi:transcriptional regulator with XRE-family HTH domain
MTVHAELFRTPSLMPGTTWQLVGGTRVAADLLLVVGVGGTRAAGTDYGTVSFAATVESLLASGTGYRTRDADLLNHGDMLRRVRQQTGLEWGQIAHALGVTRRTVHNWLAGSRVSGPNAERIAEFYNAILQALTGVPRTGDSCRRHLLEPDLSGVTPLARIATRIRRTSPQRQPVMRGADLLRPPSSAEDQTPIGVLAGDIEVVEISDDESHVRQ